MDTKIKRSLLVGMSGESRKALTARVQSNLGEIDQLVRSIVADVRERGDSALLELTHKHDGPDLSASGILVSEAEFDAAEKMVPAALRAAIEASIGNIRKHHQAQLPEMSWQHEVAAGVIAGERFTPIASVGLYVPRGKGSFPSVMAMLCTPAVLVGVPHIAVTTPPGADGSIDAASLVAARLSGVDRVYKVGGAQAIAALAFGTESVQRVEKIVGPGNQYVTAAKRVVYGSVDPGPPAGPSESIILCDEHADPEIVAREWLVEAEHGPDSAALFVTHSEDLVEAVVALIPGLISQLPEPRAEWCQTVLGRYGGIVVTKDLEDSVAFSNEYAPEHLRILVTSPESLLPKLLNAGEILLGPNTSIAFGNFAIGVNAILPTGGTARSYSCVSVDDYLKRSSFAYVKDEGVASMGRIALELARYEGFPAHEAAAQYVVDRVAAKTQDARD